METIFALSSGKGKAGVAVLRISGSKAKECLQQLGVEKHIEPRKVTLSKIYDETQVIDEALVIYFKAPASFTGEDVVELHLHGSVAVVKRVCEVLYKIKNVRPADAGEFSKRAFENGKMDLLQAEGLADLISAETNAQARQAISVYEGEASKTYELWREKIIEIMAFIEAYVDFPDEDIPHDLDKQAVKKIRTLISEIDKQLNNNKSERLREGAVAVILGNPNVGKSTLINFLSERDFAIVSDIPGTTRDTLECKMEIKGYPLTLIDTAGIRESNDRIEQEGVKRAKKKAENADFKIIILSAEDYPNFDKEILKLIDDNSIIIINKSDVKEISTNIHGFKPIICSIKQRKNVDEIINAIEARLENLMHIENPVITRSRHRTALNECKENLEKYIETRKKNMPIEISAEVLRSAAFQLGKVTGKIDVEMVLDKIFSEFCIGK